MVRAIQVLRIHLVELQKVNELCKDFCMRYIHALKNKFQSETNLLVKCSLDYQLLTSFLLQDSQPSSPSGSDVLSPYSYGPGGDQYNQNGSYEGQSPNCYGVGWSDRPQRKRRGRKPNDSVERGEDVMEGRPTGIFNLSPTDAAMLSASLDNMGDDSWSSAHSGSSLAAHYGYTGASGAKQKRGVLPKRATQIMKQWLFQNLVHPYPTEDQKRVIANQTNLTLLQVNNWFINARRRILQPMLDASNKISLGDDWADEKLADTPPVVSKKKKAATSRPSNNRFWPASLAAAAASYPVAAGLISAANTSSGDTLLEVTSDSKRGKMVEDSSSKRKAKKKGRPPVNGKENGTDDSSLLGDQMHLGGDLLQQASSYEFLQQFMTQSSSLYQNVKYSAGTEGNQGDALAAGNSQYRLDNQPSSWTSSGQDAGSFSTGFNADSYPYRGVTASSENVLNELMNPMTAGYFRNQGHGSNYSVASTPASSSSKDYLSAWASYMQYQAGGFNGPSSSTSNSTNEAPSYGFSSDFSGTFLTLHSF
ncbi:hypothetical protein Ciccas_001628 [Cichlidogyrus casuarinus]|uniref:Homeobox domain-containing protein n=1 Tax=Cichlidogyrus casuarinus TaxID=1844966 RepID=A0ABD2QJM2_9PLAT